MSWALTVSSISRGDSGRALAMERRKLMARSNKSDVKKGVTNLDGGDKLSKDFEVTRSFADRLRSSSDSRDRLNCD